MSEQSCNSDSENKRKLDAADDTVEKKPKTEEDSADEDSNDEDSAEERRKNGEPLTRDDFLEILWDARLRKGGVDNEIQKEKERIDDSYAQKFNALNEAIKNLERERHDLKERASLEKDEASILISEKHGNIQIQMPIIYDLFLLIEETKILYYPADVCMGKSCLFGCLHNIIGQESTLIDSYEYLGIKEEDRKDFRDYVVKNFELLDGIGIMRMGGRVKGYKGDETKFKIQYDYPIEIEGHPNAVPSDNMDWDEWMEDYKFQPSRKDIDWPDHKSTWASAKVKFPVKIIKMKDV